MNTPDYKTNKLLQTVRRMYQPDHLKQLSGLEYMAYSKKFTMGFEKQQNTPQIQSLLQEIDVYLTDLSIHNLKDKSLKLINRVMLTYPSPVLIWGYVLTHSLIVLLSFPLSIPGIILNLPIAYLSRRRALASQKIALANSKVKVGAYDVVASEMVKWAGVFMPAFYLVYILTAAVITAWLVDDEHPEGVRMLEWLIPVGLAAGLPVFSYYSIRLADVWYFSMVKAYAVARRNRGECPRLLARRKELQASVRRYVEVHMREKTFKGAYARADDDGCDREADFGWEEEGSDTGSLESRKVHPAKVKLAGV